MKKKLVKGDYAQRERTKERQAGKPDQAKLIDILILCGKKP